MSPGPSPMRRRYIVVPNVARYAVEVSNTGLLGAGWRRLQEVGPGGLWRLSRSVGGWLPRLVQRDFRAMVLTAVALDSQRLRALRPQVVFLSATFTDLALANMNIGLLREFAQYVRTALGAAPGVETANPVDLVTALDDWDSDIEEVLVPAARWPADGSTARHLSTRSAPMP